jgi:DegV family protein with EDD domain
MSRVGVVTDSTCCLPEELVKEYDIRIAPLILNIKNRQYRDGADITPAEFWKLFKGLDTLPTTSTISPGDFSFILKDLAQSTDAIICIMLSQALSATCNTAVKASDMLRAENPNLKIEVIDSRTAAGALGFLALEAARAARDGKKLPEIIELVRGMLKRVRYLAAFETLKYLVKGGRAPKAALIGELLQVKQIITGNNETGQIVPAARSRGKRKSLEKMLDMVSDYADLSQPLHMMVHYTDNIEDGYELERMVTSRYSCTELYMTPFTPVMACHTGPVLSLSFYT